MRRIRAISAVPNPEISASSRTCRISTDNRASAWRRFACSAAMSGPAPAGLWVAVGIGVNLAKAPADVPATSFAAHMVAPPPKPLEALGHLAEAFERWRALWDSAGFSAIADAWTARAHGLGEACTARLGSETVEGIAEGLDPDGALRLRTADGSIRRITAGDVFFGD